MTFEGQQIQGAAKILEKLQVSSYITDNDHALMIMKIIPF